MDQDPKKLYDNADKFINLANEMTKATPHGQVGAALRYAAARYSAFEASMRSKNLAAEKEKHMQFFLNTFNEMLEKNFAQYSNIQSNK